MLIGTWSLCFIWYTQAHLASLKQDLDTGGLIQLQVPVLAVGGHFVGVFFKHQLYFYQPCSFTRVVSFWHQELSNCSGHTGPCAEVLWALQIILTGKACWILYSVPADFEISCLLVKLSQCIHLLKGAWPFCHVQSISFFLGHGKWMFPWERFKRWNCSRGKKKNLWTT